MPNIYRKIITLIKNWWAWGLDYVYVTYWQLHGFIIRTSPKIYTQKKAKNRVSQIPIVLIPGIYENWRFMKPIADFLYNKGYPIYIVDGLGYNVGQVEAMAEIVHSYISAQGIKECVILAHSKGGLVGKYLLAQFNEHENIKGMISINTPFAGSRYAYLMPIKAIRIFLPNSPIISLLTSHSEINKNIISLYGEFDPHIPKGSYLEGATNIQLPMRGHFRIMKNKYLHEAISLNLKDFSKK